MGCFLYLLAVVLVVIRAIGFFGYTALLYGTTGINQ
jgi:hypothetical protein